MNGNVGTALGKVASLNPGDGRFGEVTVRAAANGWVVNRFGAEFVFRTWNEVVEKLAEIFAIDRKESEDTPRESRW